jgi:transposase
MRDGFTVTEISQKLGISRQSIYRWMARYEEGGLEALAEGSHRPKQIPNQIPAEVETRIVDASSASAVGSGSNSTPTATRGY